MCLDYPKLVDKLQERTRELEAEVEGWKKRYVDDVNDDLRATAKLDAVREFTMHMASGKSVLTVQGCAGRLICILGGEQEQDDG